MKILGGPYIGGIEQEIFTFRPYMSWLYTGLKHHYSEFYISTHQHSMFLYDWPGIKFVPVDNKYYDPSVTGIMCNIVNNKDYLGLAKQSKATIEGNDVVHCLIKYTKYDNFIVPIHKKLFQIINIKKSTPGNIVVVARNQAQELHEKLAVALDAKLLGYSCGSYDLIKAVLCAKLVVCEVGPWTALCNLHKIPVLSWGDSNISMYKSGGVYSFNNKHNSVIPGNDFNLIISGIKHLLGGIE